MKKLAAKAKRVTKDLQLRSGHVVKGGGTTATTTTKSSAFEIKDWSFNITQSLS